jgi:hypothetical protein
MTDTPPSYYAQVQPQGPKRNILDDVASDLAIWLDQTSSQIAAAMAPQGIAPFAASLSETQKLEYYRNALFNPDGTPNLQGRAAQMARLGPEGFTQVYKAVIKAYPSLRVPAPPGGEGGAPTQITPPAAPSPVPAPLLPRAAQTTPFSRIVPIVPMPTPPTGGPEG